MQLSHSVTRLYSCFFHRGAENSDLDIPPGFLETVVLRKRTCREMYLTWVKIYTSVAEKSYFLNVRMYQTLYVLYQVPCTRNEAFIACRVG